MIMIGEGTQAPCMWHHTLNSISQKWTDISWKHSFIAWRHLEVNIWKEYLQAFTSWMLKNLKMFSCHITWFFWIWCSKYDLCVRSVYALPHILIDHFTLLLCLYFWFLIFNFQFYIFKLLSVKVKAVISDQV